MSEVLSIVPKSQAEYLEMTEKFKTILDFYRFGLSIYNKKNIFLGHGTDDIQIELSSLILGSLNLPLDWPEHFWIARLTAVEKEFMASQFYKRFEKQVPTPYLIHKAYFCDLEFYVDERVLIPRSPIAELIQSGFQPWVEPDRVFNILDLCTGSACIAAACAYAFPDALVDAIDIDENALAVAEMNIDKLGLQDQVRLIQSDGLKSLIYEKYDIIVSNPPYVGAEEMETLPQEYLHEPRHALEANENGLALVHHIINEAKQYLKPDGILVVEVGNSYFAVMDAYPELPFVWLEFEHGGHGVFLLHATDLP